MIVKPAQDGWEITLQVAHALLASRLAEELRFEKTPAFWFETRMAINGHDDAKLKFLPGQTEYLTSAGAPLDFRMVEMDAEQRVIENRDRLDNARRKHRWIGLLQSMHLESLYGDQPCGRSMKSLLKSERKHRAAVLQELSVDEKDLLTAYEWMHWSDRLSLILCQDETPAMHRHLEIMTHTSGQRFDICRNDQDALVITPWPFTAPRLEVSLESRIVNQLRFTDDAELGEVLMQTPVRLRSFILQK